ncbi:MAG: alpha/beta hydrolase [Sulfuritalea sp.]|nr:alpha/beta hydrolase [Sulfuritalea sp.]
MTRHVVFIHSTGLGPFMWAPYKIAAGDARIHMPVNLGYAPGGELIRPQTVGLAEETDALCKQLGALEGDVHLVGHSYGGLVALELARSGRLPVRSLYVYEPVLFASLRECMNEITAEAADDVRSMYANRRFFDDDEQGGDEAWLEQFVDYWNGAGAWGAMPPKAKDAMRRVGWKMHLEVRAIATQARPFEAYAMPIPTMVVSGGRTTAASREMSRLLAEQMPMAQSHILPGLGHMGVMERPDKVAATLVQHLQQV